MNRQPFERLVRLEDEELESNNDTDILVTDRDSCKVALMPNDNDSTIDQINKHNKQHPANHSSPGGIGFSFNGRRILINPDQMKYLSLVTLTVQNAALSLTMRAARTQEDQFSTSVAVTVSEILKLVTCILLVIYEEGTLKAAIRSIKTNVIDNYVDSMKVAIPSLVYYIQNNLLYVGSTHLDAATCQVTYQLKILTTAVFSVVMLNKKLSRTQWVSLFVLFIGVAMIETKTVSSSHKPAEDGEADKASLAVKAEKPLLGFMAILIACCLSGFAGVYFEKILKNTTNVSLWIRNIQLTLLAITIGLIQVFVFEHEHISAKGLWFGFTPLTWLCIGLQVQGGLLVAVVVKFANNILKGFATSMAIVIATIASIFLFDFNLSLTFMMGSSMVIGSVMMYNKQ